MTSKIPPLALVKKTLSCSFASRKSTDQLESIVSFVREKTEIVHDPFWKFLPHSQRRNLCAYLRYKNVEEDSLLYLKDPKYNEPDIALLILVKGTGELACGDQILSLDFRRGPCLGSIPIPNSVKKLINQEHDLEGKQNDAYA